MFYIILGMAFVLVQLFIRKQLNKVNAAKLWPNCLLALVSNASVMFSFAWAYESILEVEIQAAMMGLLFFGLPGVILGVLTYRISKPSTN